MRFFQNFKNKGFFKLLRKTSRTRFFENTFRCIRKCKKHFFCEITKIENFDKKCLTLSKENQKSPFKHIRFGRSKSPVKWFQVFLAVFRNFHSFSGVLRNISGVLKLKSSKKSIFFWNFHWFLGLFWILFLNSQDFWLIFKSFQQFFRVLNSFMGYLGLFSSFKWFLRVFLRNFHEFLGSFRSF
jgi:hypothetical protein